MGLRHCVTVTAIVAMVSLHAAAQQREEGGLLAVKAMRCTFTAHAGVSWTDGAPVAGAQRGEPLAVELTEIDADSGTALIGSGHAALVATASALHFIERSMLGNLTVVSVFSRNDAKGRLTAVRSRHDYVPVEVPGFVSEPTLSQHYGDCEIAAPRQVP